MGPGTPTGFLTCADAKNVGGTLVTAVSFPCIRIMVYVPCLKGHPSYKNNLGLFPFHLLMFTYKNVQTYGNHIDFKRLAEY